MKRRVASALVASLAGGPVVAHAKPPKPSHMKEAEAAKKACQPYAQHIKAAEREKKLPRHTMTGLLYKESGCNPKAENKRTRARGVAQFTPGGVAAVRRIQRERGETPWFSYNQTSDPVASIKAAAEFVAWSLELCGGLAEAIRLYNVGSCGKPNAFSRAVIRLAALLRFLAAEEPAT